ncbi:hypothetical protein Esti_000902 [Eimeria stiedai]
MRTVFSNLQSTPDRVERHLADYALRLEDYVVECRQRAEGDEAASLQLKRQLHHQQLLLEQSHAQAAQVQVLLEQKIKLDEELQHLKRERQSPSHQLGLTQAVHKLPNESLRLNWREVAAEVPQLRREAEARQRLQGVVGALRGELQLNEQTMQQHLAQVERFERHQRKGVEWRARISYSETGLEEAKTVVQLLKEELQRRDKISFVTPPQSPASDTKNTNLKKTSTALHNPVHNKMVDDELASQMTRQSSIQLCSQLALRAPQSSHSRSPKKPSSHRREIGVWRP